LKRCSTFLKKEKADWPADTTQSPAYPQEPEIGRSQTMPLLARATNAAQRQQTCRKFHNMARFTRPVQVFADMTPLVEDQGLTVAECKSEPDRVSVLARA
jgi:hypothetical protein